MVHPPSFSSVLKSTGLVFGDIGTSPIYTLAVLYVLVPPTEENIFGTISLIFWALILIVTVQYAFLAMNLSLKGEGGTIVLKEILYPLLKSRLGMSVTTFFTFFGVSLMIGDCVITPAISILSAVEGIREIPGAEGINSVILIIIAIIITLALFSIQKKGTDKVGSTFGPVMVLWFFCLFVFGFISVLAYPSIIFALNPYYILVFVQHNPGLAFLSLSLIILCSTGGEALFADMGHLGREPIRWSWIFVLVALTMVYLGQGAFLLHSGPVPNPFFGMIISEISFLYIPFLILTVAATIIASQAVITGIFSIIYQAINIHLLPAIPINYTSSELRTQIYINSVNWALCIAVIFMLLFFGSSERLAAVYGIAVCGSMLITGIMMCVIYYVKRNTLLVSLSVLVTIVDIVFFLSLLNKLENGGYWSFIFAAIPFSVFLIFTEGEKILAQRVHPMDLNKFLEKFRGFYTSRPNISGTAIFFSQTTDTIPPYITKTMMGHGIIYQNNIIISLVSSDEAYGLSWKIQDLSPGLRCLTIRYGYMKVIDLLAIIRLSGIHETTIFFGINEIITDNLVWKIYALIKKVAPSFVQYYRLPPDHVHGVITRFEI